MPFFKFCFWGASFTFDESPQRGSCHSSTMCPPYYLNLLSVVGRRGHTAIDRFRRQLFKFCYGVAANNLVDHAFLLAFHSTRRSFKIGSNTQTAASGQTISRKNHVNSSFILPHIHVHLHNHLAPHHLMQMARCYQLGFATRRRLCIVRFRGLRLSW